MRTSTASAVEPAPDVPMADGPASTRRSAVLARLYWLWPVLLMLALGLFRISRTGLWRDELATWSAIDRSSGELWDLLHNIDASTGLYYFIEHFWVDAFGHSLLVMRLPSVLAMAGATLFVSLAGAKLFGRRTGLAAGVIFACIPSVSRYAQEARAYAFVMLAVAAATWLLLRALERPTALRWAAYGFSVTLTGYFHMVALTFLTAHAVIVGIRWWHGRRRALLVGFLVSAGVAVLPVLPLMKLGQEQSKDQLSWLTSPPVQYVGDVFLRGLFGSSLVSYAFLALAILPLAWPSRRRAAFEVGVMAVLPVGLLWLVSQTSSHYFLDRYLLFTLPAWALLAANVLTMLRPKVLGALGLAVLLLAGVPDQRSVRKWDSRETWTAKGAAAVIEHGYRAGDGMLPSRKPWELEADLALDYYLTDTDVHPKDVALTRSTTEIAALHAQRCADPSGCSFDTPRIWVVTFGFPWDVQQNLTTGEKKALEPYRQVSQQITGGMTVTLMQRR
ncbi:glycosyltransferase family 39 protein [Kitasatospora sp. NPDC002227]|uniref:glycosyltransferase family 39 protein n=1 Tax=Kitasatospora sp. NPDC002227 TaxID=3154773 RepID=UPI00332F0EEA